MFWIDLILIILIFDFWKFINFLKCRSSDEWGQLVIFPEGATSNRKAILNFKPGGFIPGVPVQPILVKYPNLHDTISWTWDQPHGVLGCLFYSMTQVVIQLQIQKGQEIKLYTTTNDDVEGWYTAILPLPYLCITWITLLLNITVLQHMLLCLLYEIMKIDIY